MQICERRCSEYWKEHYLKQAVSSLYKMSNCIFPSRESRIYDQNSGCEAVRESEELIFAYNADYVQDAKMYIAKK